MKRIGYIFAALTALALASACARPPAANVSGPATAIPAIKVAAADVRVDVADMETNGDVSPETVADFLRFHAGKLEIDDADGRAATPVIRVLNVSVADKTAAAFTGQLSSLSGTVALLDAETGEPIVEPSPLDVNIGPHLVGEMFGVNLRDRSEVKAEKMSKEFMRRARIALYGPNT